MICKPWRIFEDVRFCFHLWIFDECFKLLWLTLSYWWSNVSFQTKSGVKRLADTTTPSSTVNDHPVSPITPLEIAAPYLSSGKIRSRRESHRSIKKPNKVLPGEDLAKVCKVVFFSAPLRPVRTCSQFH